MQEPYFDQNVLILISDNQYQITDNITKLNVIGQHFENINSPRLTEQAINFNNTVYPVAISTINQIKTNRLLDTSLRQFSSINPSYHPSNEIDKPIFHDYIKIATIFRHLSKKASSGVDNIPIIVLKYLPGTMVKVFSAIINNSINRNYYPNRWKQAKVIPILKNGKKNPYDYTG